MTSRYAPNELPPRDLANYGLARARDMAFDAVKQLWQRRRAGGMKQTDLATKLGRDPGWVSKALRGPGNWTMRTFGELVAAMDGEIEISVHGLEDALPERSNYQAYAEYEPQLSGPTKSVRQAMAAAVEVPHSKIKLTGRPRSNAESADRVTLNNLAASHGRPKLWNLSPSNSPN